MTRSPAALAAIRFASAAMMICGAAMPCSPKAFPARRHFFIECALYWRSRQSTFLHPPESPVARASRGEPDSGMRRGCLCPAAHPLRRSRRRGRAWIRAWRRSFPLRCRLGACRALCGPQGADRSPGLAVRVRAVRPTGIRTGGDWGGLGRGAVRARGHHQAKRSASACTLPGSANASHSRSAPIARNSTAQRKVIGQRPGASGGGPQH